TARTNNVSGYEYLVASQSCRRDVEMSARTRSAAHSRVHATESRVKNVLQLTQSQVVHPDLADLRDDYESLSGHVERVRLLDISSQNEHQPIARLDPIAGV